MKYELAIKLKENGFIQPMRNVTINGSDYEEYDVSKKGDWIESPTGRFSVYFPTLSELIEACGYGFGKLVKEDRNEWYAYDYNRNIPVSMGNTPEEAVIGLWLELQSPSLIQ